MRASIRDRTGGHPDSRSGYAVVNAAAEVTIEMSEQTSSKARADIEGRLQVIDSHIERELPPHPPLERTPESQYRHLFEDAQQLYQAELGWEEETGEESTEDGAVVALVFPGTLALVDALVTRHDSSEHGEGGPHRDVVAAFVEWLAERLAKQRSGEAGGSATDRAKRADLTDRLIDLALYRYCGLTAAEVEHLDARRN